MAIPNRKPDTENGRRALSTLLWQTRKRDKKPEKDWSDTADIIAKWIIALVTAIAAGTVTVVVAQASRVGPSLPVMAVSSGVTVLD
jgi:hypothetical protein